MNFGGEIVKLIEVFISLNPLVQAALISAVISAIISIVVLILKSWIDKGVLQHKLFVEYEYEQKRKLRELIGKYHGRLVETIEQLDHRMWNLYQNEAEEWLNVKGRYTITGIYYFPSMVYRMIFSIGTEFRKRGIVY